MSWISLVTIILLVAVSLLVLKTLLFPSVEIQDIETLTAPESLVTFQSDYGAYISEPQDQTPLIAIRLRKNEPVHKTMQWRLERVNEDTLYIGNRSGTRWWKRDSSSFAVETVCLGTRDEATLFRFYRRGNNIQLTVPPRNNVNGIEFHAEMAVGALKSTGILNSRLGLRVTDSYWVVKLNSDEGYEVPRH